MTRLYRNQTWRGVDRVYRRLLALEVLGADLGHEDHIYGVMAAQELGSLSDCIYRLERAVALRPAGDEINWLVRLEAATGSVFLQGASEDGTLEMVDLPFEPEYQLAIQYTERILQKKGSFEGFLPVGLYSFNGVSFEVVSGESIRVSLTGGGKSIPQGRSTWLRTGGGTVYMGPSSVNVSPKPYWSGGPFVGVTQQHRLGLFYVAGDFNGHGYFHPDGHLVGVDITGRVGIAPGRFALSTGLQFDVSHGRRVGVVMLDMSSVCSDNCSRELAILDATEMSAWPRSVGGVLELQVGIGNKWAILSRAGLRVDGSRDYDNIELGVARQFGR